MIAVLLLFFGGCIAAVVFAIKRKGWLFTVRFGSLGLLVTVLFFDTEQTRIKFAIPLLGAVAVAWLWPHIVKQRMSEKTQEIEHSQNDEGS